MQTNRFQGGEEHRHSILSTPGVMEFVPLNGGISLENTSGGPEAWGLLPRPPEVPLQDLAIAGLVWTVRVWLVCVCWATAAAAAPRRSWNSPRSGPPSTRVLQQAPAVSPSQGAGPRAAGLCHITVSSHCLPIIVILL